MFYAVAGSSIRNRKTEFISNSENIRVIMKMMILKGRIAFPKPLIDCLSIRDKFQRIFAKGYYMYETILM